MPFLVDLVAHDYGSVSAPEGVFPVGKVADHNWNQPYPAVSAVVPFVWEPGESGIRPNVFWCPQIRDWLCDQRAYETLSALAGADLHLIAKGVMDGQPLFVVQVVAIVSGIVD